MTDLLEDLKTLIRTRHAIVTVDTTDEEFASRMIRQAGQELDLVVMEWTVTDGLRRITPTEGGVIASTEPLVAALSFMRANDHDNLYIFKDSLGHLARPKAQRLLRDIGVQFARDRRTKAHGCGRR